MNGTIFKRPGTGTGIPDSLFNENDYLTNKKKVRFI